MTSSQRVLLVRPFEGPKTLGTEPVPLSARSEPTTHTGSGGSCRGNRIVFLPQLPFVGLRTEIDFFRPDPSSASPSHRGEGAEAGNQERFRWGP